MTTYWNVAPRYTSGSPAMVDEATARRVAEQEQAAVAAIMLGMCGPEEKARAERLGLEGIVWSCSGRIMIDVITGTRRGA